MLNILAISETTASLVGACAGFAGGVVAAGITEYIRGRRDRASERRRVKAAIRLIEEELRNSHDAAEKILEGALFAPFPTQAWEAERVRLAAVLEESHWRSVAKAYDRVQGYNWRLQAQVLTNDLAERETICRKIVQDSSAARGVLRQYAREAE
jgi:hypothetical protein